MKELIKYLVIRLTTRHAKTAIEVYETLYPKKQQPIIFTEPHPQAKAVPVQKSKKDELLESLNYLKSKKVKSKQDKESIYTLETVLKNM